MKKTFRETIQLKKKRLMEKHRFFRFPIALFMETVLLIYHIGLYFKTNTKRYTSIGAVFLYFFISTSFAFQGVPQEVVSENMEFTLDIAAGDVTKDVTEAQNYDEAEFEEIELLDDEDVAMASDDLAMSSTDNVDKYSLEDILESTELSVEIQADVKTDYSDYIFDKEDWRLVLINKEHPIPEDYSFNLGTIKANMQCDERIIEDLLAMLQGAKNDGVTLVICSPYRDYSRQEMLFNRKINAYIGKGMSYMEAYKAASRTVTVPGASEHQIGLAVDIISDTYTSLNTGFGDTQAGKWLAEHSCEYGFILRYPLGKEYITGIQYEPWHFRYVGVEAATVMTNEGTTLEEFLEDLS